MIKKHKTFMLSFNKTEKTFQSKLPDKKGIKGIAGIKIITVT